MIDSGASIHDTPQKISLHPTHPVILEGLGWVMMA